MYLLHSVSNDALCHGWCTTFVWFNGLCELLAGNHVAVPCRWPTAAFVAEAMPPSTARMLSARLSTTARKHANSARVQVWCSSQCYRPWCACSCQSIKVTAHALGIGLPSLPPASFTRMPLSTNLAKSSALSFLDIPLLLLEVLCAGLTQQAVQEC